MPPLDHTPSGTSLTSSSRTDSRNGRRGQVPAARHLPVIEGIGREPAAASTGVTLETSVAPFQIMAGRQLFDAPSTKRPRTRHVQQREEVTQRRAIQTSRDIGMLEENLQLRAKDQIVADTPDIQRLDPQPVARQEAAAGRAPTRSPSRKTCPASRSENSRYPTG